MDDCTREQFWAARDAEFKSLTQMKAMTVLNHEQSAAFEAEHPECVLKSDWVEKWKPLDDGGHKAKSRLVVLGYEDPMVLDLIRSAPTPTLEGFHGTMQLIAGRGWDGYSVDVKNAFGQSLPTNR
eukprot:10883174-Lingulodinium_polyedra.AAC.1